MFTLLRRKLFIPALIARIWLSPSSVKWALFSSNSATLQKSWKSSVFIPSGKYSLKKGIIFSDMSENFVHLNFTMSSEYLLMIPQLKKEVKLSINSSSRICWAISNSNLIWYPTLWWEDLKILTKKEPSPLTLLVKPAIHIPNGIGLRSLLLSFTDLVERVYAKAAFNSSDSPQFKDAFIHTISFNPFRVKCLLASIISTTAFHKI